VAWRGEDRVPQRRHNGAWLGRLAPGGGLTAVGDGLVMLEELVVVQARALRDDRFRAGLRAYHRAVVADSASMQRSRRSGLRAKPAARAEDVPRELDLTRLEDPLPIVPLVDGDDGFVDRECSVVSRNPVHGGE
jgi:hypothetical protein